MKEHRNYILELSISHANYIEMKQVKRRAKRISDRNKKEDGYIPENEKPFLYLLAGIIAEICIREMNEDEIPQNTPSKPGPKKRN